jgi:hypothetical protein
MQKTYTIKSEDKAAFINRLDKLGIKVGSFDITNNKLDDSFSISFTEPSAIATINTILKQSHKIDQVKAPKAVYTDKRATGSDIGLNENNINNQDVIKVDVPLFIRLLEYAREDAKADLDLHNVAENIIKLSKTGEVLNMDQYPDIVKDASKLDEASDFNPSEFDWGIKYQPKSVSKNSIKPKKPGNYYPHKR